MFETNWKRLVVIIAFLIIIFCIIIVYWPESLPKNDPPIADAGDDIIINTNQPILISGHRSRDPDGYITNYTWEFSDGFIAYGINVTRFFSDNGNYYATLTIIDNEGTKELDEINITVINVPSLAKADVRQFLRQYIRPPSLFRNYTASPPHYVKTNYTNKSTIYTFDTLYFNASDSLDTDGHISNYTWYFDDGGVEYGIETTHRFFDNGIHIITLITTDDDGATSHDNISVNIFNRPPFAYIGVDTIVNKNNNITLNASLPLPIFSQIKSYDPDGQIVNYTWDFGDDSIGFGEIVTHKYQINGTYLVNLTVRDDDGAENSDIAIIVVSNVPPIAYVEKYIIGNITEPIAFNGSGIDEDGEIVFYEWDFDGNGKIDWNSTVDGNTTYVFNEMGIYLARLTVIDNDGAMDTNTLKVCIGNGTSFPPIAIAEISGIDPDYETKLYLDKIFCSGLNSINLDNDNLTYYWDFGDNDTGEGGIINHTYSYSNGDQWIKSDFSGYHQRTYQIELMVNDGEFSDAAVYYMYIYINTGPWLIDHTIIYIDEGKP